MRSFASFVMSGRLQALLAVAGAALLSLYLPPLSYISGAAAALVVLRHGAREGALVMGGAVAALALFGLALQGDPTPQVAYGLALWAPLWVIGLVLRHTVSLRRAFEATALLVGVGVVLVYLSLGDPAAAWREILAELFARLGGEAGGALNVELGNVAQVMTGMAAGAAMVSALLCLLLARWWQALLYNPGGFGKEFHALRMGRTTALTALGLFLVAAFAEGPEAGPATNLALVMVVLFLFEGIATIHAVVARRGIASGWLVLKYVLLIIALPQMVVALSAVGFADAWVDFRARLGGTKDNETD